MASFSLLITANPYISQGHYTALRFAERLLANGHSLKQVFFYSDAVLVANRLNSPAADEINLTKSWAKLAIQHDIELTVCITAALKRGIVNQAEAERNALTGDNLAPAFDLSGLGQLNEALLTTDRHITFG